jgi:hypothetical protein
MGVAKSGTKMQETIPKPWLRVTLSEISVMRILGAMSNLIQ